MATPDAGMGADVGIRKYLRRPLPPASHTLFSWGRCCQVYCGGEYGGAAASDVHDEQDGAANASSVADTAPAVEGETASPEGSRASVRVAAPPLPPRDAEEEDIITVAAVQQQRRDCMAMLYTSRHHSAARPFVCATGFLDPASLLRLSRVSTGCLIAMERFIWYLLLGEPRSRLQELSQQYPRATAGLISGSSSGGAGTSAVVAPPPPCWRRLFMRRACRPWVVQTRQLAKGVSRVLGEGSYRQKYECHLFEVALVGYNAEALVRAHCCRNNSVASSLPAGARGSIGGKQRGGLPTGPTDTAALERSNAYFTEHSYEDARAPYMETQIRCARACKGTFSLCPFKSRSPVCVCVCARACACVRACVCSD
jgi:hypothetical protein